MGTAVGVDVGIKHLAVLSTGVVISNPRPLEHRLRKLRRIDRQLARCTPGSKRGELARRRLARAHVGAANLRRDALHKLTTALATEHAVIVVEHLNVAGMLHNRRLARTLGDAGLAELRRQLSYKTAWYGSRLLVADRFYPSSKTCSRCGWVKAKLSLNERMFLCAACGLVIDRDLNAARNLVNLIDNVARSGRETQNARAVDVRPGPAGLATSKREAGAESPRIGPAPSVRKYR